MRPSLCSALLAVLRFAATLRSRRPRPTYNFCGPGLLAALPPAQRQTVLATERAKQAELARQMEEAGSLPLAESDRYRGGLLRREDWAALDTGAPALVSSLRTLLSCCRLAVSLVGLARADEAASSV